MSLLIGFFLLSIFFSFLCSIWEAVLLSITPSYVKRLENESPKVGLLVSKLKKDIDKPLSAILTLNTIAHTVGAIGVGAQAGKVFGSKSLDIFGFGLSYESLIAAFMTLAILFLSEIIPKTIGANNWKSLAPITAKSLNLLIMVLSPFVFVSNLLTKTMKKEKNKSIFSKQDFAAMTDVIGESGGLSKADYNLIKNVLAFDELKAKDIMTPKTVMVMANESLHAKDFYESSKPLSFSRIPIFQESKDNVTGVLLKNDLLENLINDKPEKALKEIKRSISAVKEDASLREVFEILNESREHIAIVVDQYGVLLGLLTLEDIFETLFGLEIIDETDSITDLQAYARKKWEERAKKLGLVK